MDYSNTNLNFSFVLFKDKHQTLRHTIHKWTGGNIQSSCFKQSELGLKAEEISLTHKMPLG